MRLFLPLFIIVGIILGFLAYYPQWNLKSIRGAEYNGAFASNDLDEMAYASYIQALVDGRPRKNDPYTGRDQAPESPQPESLFSIQFSTAYLVAGPVAFAGVGTWQAMPILSIVLAVATGLMLMILLFYTTKDVWWAAAGTLVVLLGGAMISGLGVYASLMETGVAYPYFPFLRRHIPSLSFPFLFGVLLFTWLGLNSKERDRRIVFGVLTSVFFSVLVFSYFYVWTATAAVLAAWFVSTLIVSKEDRKENVSFFVYVGSLCLIPLLPYAYFLSKRNQMMDTAQLLVYTREFDLFRNVEIIGAGMLIVLIVIYFTKRNLIPEKAVALIAAISTSPIIVFNQQVITGRSLQPFHYEYYVTNYLILVAVVVFLVIVGNVLFENRKQLMIAFAVVVGLSSVAWGYLEAVETTRFWDEANVVRDSAMPVNLRLRELADGDVDTAKTMMTLNLESLQGDSQPTVAANPVLWARHQHAFVGLNDWEENIVRYFKLIYYSDLDGEWLRKSISNCSNIEACMALFGWDRFNATLSSAARPLTAGEIDDAVKRYEEFIEKFDLLDAREHQVSYVVLRPADQNRLQNFRRWYLLDEGEVHGEYVLYRADLNEN